MAIEKNGDQPEKRKRGRPPKNKSITAISAKDLLAIMKNRATAEFNEQMYLFYAPTQFVDLWHRSGVETQKKFVEHVQFTRYGPEILTKSGKTYRFDPSNLYLGIGDEPMKAGYIQTVGSRTYFSWKAMGEYAEKHDLSMPTTQHYLEMMEVMPAGDVKKKSQWGHAGYQLSTILGLQAEGFIYEGVNCFSDTGCFIWTSTGGLGDQANAFHMFSEQEIGMVDEYHKDFLMPIRPFRKKMKFKLESQENTENNDPEANAETSPYTP